MVGSVAGFRDTGLEAKRKKKKNTGKMGTPLASPKLYKKIKPSTVQKNGERELKGRGHCKMVIDGMKESCP